MSIRTWLRRTNGLRAMWEFGNLDWLSWDGVFTEGDWISATCSLLDWYGLMQNDE